jgi:outer membrane biosynthesis protein TonB
VASATIALGAIALLVRRGHRTVAPLALLVLFAAGAVTSSAPSADAAPACTPATSTTIVATSTTIAAAEPPVVPTTTEPATTTTEPETTTTTEPATTTTETVPPDTDPEPTTTIDEGTQFCGINEEYSAEVGGCICREGYVRIDGVCRRDVTVP